MIREENEQELITTNAKVANVLAKLHKDRGLSIEELVAAGNEGLLEAARRYDKSRGIKFVPYAVWFIRKAMEQAIAEKKM